MKCKPVHKLTALALCVLLCVASCAVAFAQGTVYTIKEIDDMQLTIGSELMAVTRSTDSSDGYFALPNNSYDDVMKKMADSGIYLLATDSQQSITLSVSMFENDDTRTSPREVEHVASYFPDSTLARAAHAARTAAKRANVAFMILPCFSAQTDTARTLHLRRNLRRRSTGRTSPSRFPKPPRRT